jgi:hypothetical protein
MKPARLLEHPLIAELLKFDLNPDDFLIFGSGPLLAHGVRDVIHDLDIVARGSAWRWARTFGSRSEGAITGSPAARFLDGRIVFFDRWISPYWDTDELIDRADIYGGLRFARLADVLAYKRMLLRPKDIEDIEDMEAMARFLPAGPAAVPAVRPAWNRCPAAACARTASLPLSAL